MGRRKRGPMQESLDSVTATGAGTDIDARDANAIAAIVAAIWHNDAVDVEV